MKSKNYHPNFKDKRIQSRCYRALGFVCGCLTEDRAKPWSSRYLDQYLGHSGNQLSSYLRNILLVVSDNHYSMSSGKCKKYCKNPTGIKFIKQSLAGTITCEWSEYCETSTEPTNSTELNSTDLLFDQRMIANFVEAEYGDQLRSGNFDYNDRSQRLWHTLQNIRSVHKKPILSNWGYHHQYDIVCCAPSIIEQISRRMGNDLWMPELERYLDYTTEYRNSIARDLEIDVKTTKIFINSLFCGARVGHNPDFATSELLHNDFTRIQLAKTHPAISALREDIKTCWSSIIKSGDLITRRRDVETGRLKPVSSSDKWSVYFRYERQVLSEIQKHLQSLGVKFFLEHDGWSSSEYVDVESLQRVIKNTTGMDLNIKYERIDEKENISITIP